MTEPTLEQITIGLANLVEDLDAQRHEEFQEAREAHAAWTAAKDKLAKTTERFDALKAAHAEAEKASLLNIVEDIPQ